MFLFILFRELLLSFLLGKQGGRRQRPLVLAGSGVLPAPGGWDYDSEDW